MANYAYPNQIADPHETDQFAFPGTPNPQVVVGTFEMYFYGRWVKPAVDLLGGLVLTILTAPIVLVIVATILVSMGRPAIFRQRRVGKNGRVFSIFKFRTMQPDRRNGGNQYDGPNRRERHKSERDPRHTPVGRFLRKWSLDEIPQFWNVVLGHMSLVGPRPEMVEIVETKYELWQHQRHLVKPGVTGLWQISARCDETLMYEHTHVDLEYVKNITFLSDTRILLRTVPAMLGVRLGS